MIECNLDRTLRRLTPVELLRVSLLSALVFVCKLLRTWSRRIDRALNRKLGRILKVAGGRGAVEADVQPGSERVDPEGSVEVKAQRARSAETKDGGNDGKHTFSRRRAWLPATSLSTQDSLKSLPSPCGFSLSESSAHQIKTIVREIRSARKELVCNLCPGSCECPTYYSAMDFLLAVGFGCEFESLVSPI
ncbi:hypothetical protein KC19_VG131600 [Ceratodon purpureus]|uniref:Uncharacterized protein n=1 Tax=Ceratodon purpureus TaxID=3225 RepID=A0A8T0HPQ9_CERPU|nr:hypothetical protein KC19_VG131600 [Ceratodon purpureus]